ncbi:MAG: hypothetical protein AB7K52_14005 [Phycisphaerales bacterium]
MKTFRCTGRDAFVGEAREWWVEAASADAARELVEAKGLRGAAIVEAPVSERPTAAPLYRMPGPVVRSTAARRRTRLILLGMALGLFAVAMFLFAVKASSHLGRGRPPVQGVP